jgi:hypothetical protein
MDIEKFIVDNEIINQMPSLLVALDLNSKFIATNKTGLLWTGFKSGDAMAGKTYGDMPCKASEQHDSFIEQDGIILKNNGCGKILGFIVIITMTGRLY